MAGFDLTTEVFIVMITLASSLFQMWKH